MNACKLGLEGIVSKKLNAPYKSGPSKAWLKIKNPKAPGSYTGNRGNVLSPTQMILYHVTSSENAAAIKRDGFRDTGGSYMTESEHRGVEHRGVWLFDRPLDANEGAWGDTAIAVDLPLSEADLDQYEWKEEGKVYREWLIPAAIINKYWWLLFPGYSDRVCLTNGGHYAGQARTLSQPERRYMVPWARADQRSCFHHSPTQRPFWGSTVPIELGEFLRSGKGPEQQALLRLIATLVEVPPYA